jgi:hypothetical protein
MSRCPSRRPIDARCNGVKPLVVLGINVGPELKYNTGNFEVTFGRREMERGVSAVVVHVHICAMVQQEVHNVLVSFAPTH